MKPPFEIYGKVHIADTEGHICTCEDPQIAKEVLVMFNFAVSICNGDIAVVSLEDPAVLHDTLKRTLGE